MMRLLQLSILLALMASNAIAQVSIDSPVILINANSDQRQVLGLPPSILVGDVLSGAVDQSGALAYGAATAVSPQNWEVTIEGLPEDLVQGTHVLIEVPLNASGVISLAINGNEAVPVNLRGGSALDGELFDAGSLLSLVYDGTAFQLMNGPTHVRRPCPNGMVEVNEATCIDIDDNAAPTPFFDAVMVCIEQNKRMCTWGEWFMSCRRAPELGLLNMENGFEWTANTANYNGAVRIVGSVNCYSAATENVYEGSRTVRCCLPR